MGICGKIPKKLVQCTPPGLWNWETGVRDEREKPYFLIYSVWQLNKAHSLSFRKMHNFPSLCTVCWRFFSI